MVVMSAMGFRRRTQADTGDDHHERSDAKTLNKRHGAIDGLRKTYFGSAW